jgi:hypothetical protein
MAAVPHWDSLQLRIGVNPRIHDGSWGRLFSPNPVLPNPREILLHIIPCISGTRACHGERSGYCSTGPAAVLLRRNQDRIGGIGLQVNDVVLLQALDVPDRFGGTGKGRQEDDRGDPEAHRGPLLLRAECTGPDSTPRTVDVF